MEFDPVLMAAVFGLVNYAKSLGLSAKLATVLSMTLGVLAIFGQAKLVSADFQLILSGVIFGLATSGFYDIGVGASQAYRNRA